MKIIISTSNERAKYVGKCLTEDIQDKYVVIYRACPADVNKFVEYDYVTLKRNWAIGHAQHSVVYHEEPQHVIRAMVETKYVFHAPNTDEYFYVGPTLTKVLEIKRFNVPSLSSSISIVPIPYTEFRQLVHKVDPTTSVFCKSDLPSSKMICLGSYIGKTLTCGIAAHIEPVEKFVGRGWVPLICTEVAFIDIAVDQEYRNNGFGKLLVGELEKRLSMRCAKLWCANKTNLPSIALAKSLGFREQSLSTLTNVPKEFAAEKHLVWMMKI